MYYVRSINFKDSYKLPVVFYARENRPSISFFEYLLFKLRMRHAYSTLQKKAYAVSNFFNFVYSQHNSLVDNLIINAEYKILIDLIQRYKLLVLNNNRSQSNYKYILLKSLSEYLEYVNSNFNIQLPKHLIEIPELTISNKTQSNKRNIDESHLEKMLDVSHPDSSFNPFSSDLTLRFRNYLIIRILYETGMRMGELMSLTINSYQSIDDRYYIRIQLDKRVYDPRHSQAAIKNFYSQRELSISEETHLLLHHYITKVRRKQLVKIEPYPPTQFIFLSSKHKPISNHAIFNLIKKVNDKVNFLLDTSFSAKPHDFRYAFANNFLKYLVEDQSLDMELAKDNLRNIMGWCPSSNMPSKYAANFISDKANQLNISRITNSYGN